jgi:hypothetical protein
MDTYTFTVSLEVQVEAFSEDDAKELVEDVFGPGSDCGVEVVDFNIK